MASRGSALSRSLTYFREAQIDEARVAFQLVREIMDARLKQAAAARSRQVAVAGTPRKTRAGKAKPAPAPVQTTFTDENLKAVPAPSQAAVAGA